MIALSDNILQIHYFGNKCMIKTNVGLMPLNEQVSFLIDFIKTNNLVSLDDITCAFISKFNIKAQYEDIYRLIKTYVYESKYSSKYFCERRDINQLKDIDVSGTVGRYVPYLLNIELTNVCNLNCSHCYKEANCYETNIWI